VFWVVALLTPSARPPTAATLAPRLQQHRCARPDATLVSFFLARARDHVSAVGVSGSGGDYEGGTEAIPRTTRGAQPSTRKKKKPKRASERESGNHTLRQLKDPAAASRTATARPLSAARAYRCNFKCGVWGVLVWWCLCGNSTPRTPGPEARKHPKEGCGNADSMCTYVQQRSMSAEGSRGAGGRDPRLHALAPQQAPLSSAQQRTIKSAGSNATEASHGMQKD